MTGQGSYVTQPDPKRPGQYLWKLWAREFVIEAPDKAVSGTLKGVSAVLFQNGKESARMVAPQAQGNNVQSIIVATGGVVVRSVVQPGTILRADTVTWYARSNKIVAVGQVFYKNGKTGMTINPSGGLIADTVLKSVRSDGGGRIKPSVNETLHHKGKPLKLNLRYLGVCCALAVSAAACFGKPARKPTGPITIDYKHFEYSPAGLHLYGGVRLTSSQYLVSAGDVLVEQGAGAHGVKRATATPLAGEQVSLTFQDVAAMKSMKALADKAVVIPDPSRPSGARIDLTGNVLLEMNAAGALDGPSKTTLEVGDDPVGRGSGLSRASKVSTATPR